MKFPRVSVFVALSGIAAPTRALQSNAPESPLILSDATHVCDSQGRTSKCEVELDVPDSCLNDDGSTSDCPIVFFFHGAGGTNDWFARTSGAHAANVIGVYPQGEDGWNTGPKESNDCGWDDFDCSTDPDEGAFVAGIIAELRVRGAMGNVYLIGNSNGAALSMRLASNADDGNLPVKGVVTKVTQLLASPPRSGPGVLNYNQPDGSRLVSVLNIMGTADGVIPYEGGGSSVFGGDDAFQLMSAMESMDAWAEHNGCDAGPTVTEGVSYANSNDPNGQATFYEYQGCPEGVIVEHYAVHGAGHSFGPGAELDGTLIDYDLAYQFINRVEGTGGGGGGDGGGGGGGGGSDPCEDDPDWRGKFNPAHTCAYVGESPTARCRWEGADGTLASASCGEACGDDCGGSDAPTPGPSPGTPVPTSSDECEDDLDWHGKFNAAHDCDYVAEYWEVRCAWEDTAGTLASVACMKACGGC